MSQNQSCTGIFDTQDGRIGFVRPFSTEMRPSRADAFVAPPVIFSNRLRNGVLVDGTCTPGSRGLQLTAIESLNGVPLPGRDASS